MLLAMPCITATPEVMVAGAIITGVATLRSSITP